MDSMYAIDESGQLHFFGLGRKALPPDLGPVVAVAAGLEHTAALRATGELLCFGANHWGECDVPQDLGRILSVAVGDFHTCALKATGELTCFGKNEDGQCDVPGDLGPVVAIAAGAYHTCAVNSRCELVSERTIAVNAMRLPISVLWPSWQPGRTTLASCELEWRAGLFRNSLGQCDVPPALGPVVAVAAGYHTCAVKASGELVCFRNHEHEQCDVPPGLGPVVSVAAGQYHTCAVKANGEVRCFGWDFFGQCNVPPDFKVPLSLRTSCVPIPDTIRNVLQPGCHDEPASPTSRSCKGPQSHPHPPESE